MLWLFSLDIHFFNVLFVLKSEVYVQDWVQLNFRNRLWEWHIQSFRVLIFNIRNHLVYKHPQTKLTVCWLIISFKSQKPCLEKYRFRNATDSMNHTIFICVANIQSLCRKLPSEKSIHHGTTKNSLKWRSLGMANLAVYTSVFID